MTEKESRDYTTSYAKWNNSMKKTHKILVPDMLPWHFLIIERVLKAEGYDVEVLKNEERKVIDEGLKHVHNDTCYPCLCVAGQYIDALQSGKYDLNRTGRRLPRVQLYAAYSQSGSRGVPDRARSFNQLFGTGKGKFI